MIICGMKKLLSLLIYLSVCVAVSAQSDMYERRYGLLVSQFGPAGVGVETVLDNWEKADSVNVKMLEGRFNYLFEKSRSVQIEVKPSRKYLGMDPLFVLKDSLDNDVCYYQVSSFNDSLYVEAVRAADKAISIWPDLLDFRFMKTNAYIAYEKESPDMALDCLLSLVSEYSSRKEEWKYAGVPAGDDFFQDAMQEYCFSFYALGTSAGYDAFVTLSRRMSDLYPENTAFMNNIATYHLVALKDYKTAFKLYDRILKKFPGDRTAIMNALAAARSSQNLKQERKYLEMLGKYGSEFERLQAQGRLKALEGKK